MEKDLKNLEELFDSKLHDVKSRKEDEKHNQKYADAIFEIVEQALTSATRFNSEEEISFKNEVMGNFVNTDNIDSIDHIGSSYAKIGNTGIEIHLHYNYYSEKRKPSCFDEKFDLKMINKLLKKYNITVTETCEEFGSNDTYIIKYIKTMKKENEKQKTKKMTKPIEKENK